jgi:hypothetical protein
VGVQVKYLVSLAAAAFVATVLASASVAAPPTGQLTATPTTIDFGTLTLGDAAVRMLTIHQHGKRACRYLEMGRGGRIRFHRRRRSLLFRAHRLENLGCVVGARTKLHMADRRGQTGRCPEPPGTDEGACAVWGLEDVELIRVPLIVTIVLPS